MNEENRNRQLEQEAEAVDPTEQIDGVEEALQDMVAHERRRDQDYRTTGDNTNPGVDVDIDSNAPKYDEDRRK